MTPIGTHAPPPPPGPAAAAAVTPHGRPRTAPDEVGAAGAGGRR
ncbi:hypothetical protein SAMN05216499_10257 [Actinacidiphila paucisporea]|uniref:Uncharacterized protein n=1 Tax=Actinacidiphila paucisporea TaxID=310782 RepID=A0A1M6WCF1_9ACTN|nr:hypothetical protein SAMN05216499_10257 [Actinacidiphila paucisporea]